MTKARWKDTGPANPILKEVNKVALMVQFVDNKPMCPAIGCGSYQFDMTFLLIGSGKWEIESIYCDKCNTEIEVTPELRTWLKGEEEKKAIPVKREEPPPPEIGPLKIFKRR